jgi:hypothetical protein
VGKPLPVSAGNPHPWSRARARVGQKNPGVTPGVPYCGHNNNPNSNNNNGEGEDIVQCEIEAALECKNLDRERGMAGEAGAESESALHCDIKNSTALLGDFEEVWQKVEKYCERASLMDHLSLGRQSLHVTSTSLSLKSLSLYLTFLLMHTKQIQR